MNAVPFERPMIAYSRWVSGSTQACRLEPVMPGPPPIWASGTCASSETLRDVKTSGPPAASEPPVGASCLGIQDVGMHAHIPGQAATGAADAAAANTNAPAAHVARRFTVM